MQPLALESKPGATSTSLFGPISLRQYQPFAPLAIARRGRYMPALARPVLPFPAVAGTSFAG
jgi:hypothetical protein